MTNEQLKKKIINLLDEATGSWYEDEDGMFAEGYSAEEGDNRFKAHVADALIAAGIGDVTEWKEKAKKHRVQVLPDGTIKQLYSDEEVEQIVKEREEYKHRAEVAERALRNITERASCNICDNFSCRYYEGINYDYNAEDCIKWWLAQAEKELAEEGKE